MTDLLLPLFVYVGLVGCTLILGAVMLDWVDGRAE